MADQPVWEEVLDDLPPNPIRTSGSGPHLSVAAYQLVYKRGRIRHGELMHLLMPLVPPGVAYRAAERIRVAGQRLRHASIGKRRDGTIEQAVRSGQRQVAYDTIWQLVRNRRVRFETDEDGVRWVVYDPDYTRTPRVR